MKEVIPALQLCKTIEQLKVEESKLLKSIHKNNLILETNTYLTKQETEKKEIVIKRKEQVEKERIDIKKQIFILKKEKVEANAKTEIAKNTQKKEEQNVADLKLEKVKISKREENLNARINKAKSIYESIGEHWDDF